MMSCSQALPESRNGLRRLALTALFVVVQSGTSFVQAQTPPAVPVRTVTVAADPVRVWLSAEGTAQALRREYLWFDRAGRVVEIGTDSDGNPLREGSQVLGPSADGAPGQFIARLDVRSEDAQVEQGAARARAAERRVISARNAVLAAQRQLAAAEEQLARSRQLAERGMIQGQRLTQDESTVALMRLQISSREAELSAAMAEAEAARSGVSQAVLKSEGGVLRAPFDGVLGFFNLREGDQAAAPPSAALTEAQRMQSAAAVVIDTSAFEVTLNLPAYESMLVERGQYAELTWSGFGGFDDETSIAPVVPAVVHAVNAVVSPDSRGVQVRLRTEGGSVAMRDGMFVAARIATGERAVAASVPLRALRFDKGDAYVFVLDAAAGTVTRRAVRAGFADGRQVEIVSGLVAGEVVVSEGHHRLSDGMAVTVLGSGA